MGFKTPTIAKKLLEEGVHPVMPYNAQCPLKAISEKTIDRVFADLKQKHGLRWINLKGLGKVQCRRCLFLLRRTLKISHLKFKGGTLLQLQSHSTSF
ncbi:transposase [Niallia circulans]|nr:hypothetical protein CHH59_21025 [Shouchella clausii]SPT81610.1 transposase [Niallia circulans]